MGQRHMRQKNSKLGSSLRNSALGHSFLQKQLPQWILRIIERPCTKAPLWEGQGPNLYCLHFVWSRWTCWMQKPNSFPNHVWNAQGFRHLELTTRQPQTLNPTLPPIPSTNPKPQNLNGYQILDPVRWTSEHLENWKYRIPFYEYLQRGYRGMRS